MEVRLRLPAALRELGPGTPVLAFDLEASPTVEQLLDALAAAHPAVERRIRDERRRLRPHVNLFVGDENIRSLDGPSTSLKAGDEVSVVAAVSGGKGRLA